MAAQAPGVPVLVKFCCSPEVAVSGESDLFSNRIDIMNKLSVSQIRHQSAVYYAVGIAAFSAFFVVLAVIVELVQRNS